MSKSITIVNTKSNKVVQNRKKEIEQQIKEAEKQIKEAQLAQAASYEESSDVESSQEATTQVKAETGLKIEKVSSKTGGIRKARRAQHVSKYVLPSELGSQFRGPTRDNSSVIGIQSINGSSCTLRNDLLVASKLFANTCKDLAQDLEESMKGQEIVLGHYSATLSSYIVLTDMSNGDSRTTRQTLVDPNAFGRLVGSLEDYMKQTTSEDSDTDDEIEDLSADTQTLC
jgi:hypothetical protein